MQPALNTYDYLGTLTQLHIDPTHLSVSPGTQAHLRVLRQVTVVGLTYGGWGVAKYGSAPVKVDALDFWCDRLRELMRQISVQQTSCRGKTVPSAFVTFRWVVAAVASCQGASMMSVCV